MLFYFIRHGQTEANRQGVLAGSGLDYPLNEEGHKQARDLAAKISTAVTAPVAKIVVSNMLRARQTAGYVAQELGLDLSIEPDFREWHLGEWEGRAFHEFGHLILGDGEPAAGESRKVFYSRVEKAWQNVHSDQEPYIVVSHGGVWLALQDILRIPRFAVDNCDLVKVQLQGSSSQWRAEILKAR